MPALNDRYPTTTPDPTRRRVWKYPDLKSHSLLVLTADRLHLTPLAGDPKPDTVTAAEAGADLEDLLGPLATVVDLAAVRRVKLDLQANSLMVEYRGTGRQTTGGLTVVFATPDEADACFSKVWRRLGDACQLVPYQRDTWALARTPLVLMAVVLLVTGFLALAVGTLDDVPDSRTAAVSIAGVTGVEPQAVRRSPLAVLFGWMNWQGVCAAGGVVAGVLQVWLYRRLTRPPVGLELVRA